MLSLGETRGIVDMTSDIGRSRGKDNGVPGRRGVLVALNSRTGLAIISVKRKKKLG